MNPQSTSQASPQQTGNETKYFDLHTEGLGYLNRIRVVPVKKGEAYLCCAISALRANADEPEYTYFDLKVSGAAAKEAVGILRTAVDNDQKVLIGFKAGDTYPEVFTYENGPKKGQTGVSTKGRLLQVRWARIDGLPVDLPGEHPTIAEQGGAVSSTDTPEPRTKPASAALASTSVTQPVRTNQAGERPQMAAHG